MKSRLIFLVAVVSLRVVSYTHAQTGPTVHLQADAVITLPAGAGLAAIADGDFNHDNRRDLAVCERNLGQVALYMRSAAGTYSTAKYTYAVGKSPSGLVSFNHNPGIYHADLMALSGPSSQWTMLRDDLDSTGNLVALPYPLSFGTSRPSPRPQLVQADIDQDGYPDFAYTYPLYFDSFINYSPRRSLLGPPAPTQPPYDTPQLNTGTNTSTSLTLADFDRDGYLDPLFTDSTYNNVRLIYHFQTQVNALVTSGRGPVCTSAQDIDGDQVPDLAVAYAGSNEVMLLRTTPPYDFNRAYSYALPASPRRVLLADLNQDFYPELLVVTADNKLRVYQHNGTASSLCYTTIPPQVLATGVNPSILQIAYLNDDPYPDIVVGCAGDNTVHTYLNRTSTVTATRANQALAGVEVYPTLVTDQVTVKQSSPQQLEATLFDEVGHPVRQQTLIQASSTLLIADLPRGLYLLRLVGAAGTRTTRLLVQ